MAPLTHTIPEPPHNRDAESRKERIESWRRGPLPDKVGAMRVLVVEDQRKMAKFIEQGLGEAGYSVDLAETGSSAELLASENEYDLIILDVMLPDQNGLDTARHLRSDGFEKPILMLTALSGTKDKVAGLDSGADDYLAKPFEFDELLARVRALLRRQTTGGVGSVLRFEDIEMDLVKRKAGPCR
jgi:DNA-binding response OmpR family regulator